MLQLVCKQALGKIMSDFVRIGGGAGSEGGGRGIEERTFGFI